MKNQVRINKIALESFIDTLMDIYQGGVIFIDLVVVPDYPQATISIVVKEEYIDNDAVFEQEETMTDFSALSEDEINQLI